MVVAIDDTVIRQRSEPVKPQVPALRGAGAMMGVLTLAGLTSLTMGLCAPGL